MCGISGAFGCTVPLARMSEVQAHRGPEATGSYTAEGVQLASQRLRILDIDGGDQPITNEDGDVVVVFNGEIYNFRELRASLEAVGHRFATATDTEVVVHGYEEYGPGIFERLNGMFAIAIYDERRDQLVLARDHVGVKPLHIATVDDGLVFASEPKSILATETIVPTVDTEALRYFLQMRYSPHRSALFEGIEEVPAGTVLTAARVDGDLRIDEQRFWHPAAVSREPPADPAGAVRAALGDAVERQLVSDRPVGFYLSGGLDTSSVVALASEIADEPIHTFCMGFRDAAWDERPHAREVAEHFGTIHHELAIEDRFMRSFPEMIWHADEPKRNLYPYFVAEAMKQHVTVALGGLGADELFGGYVYRIRRLRELARMRAAAGVELRETIRSLADERIDRQLDTEELRGDAALEDWGVLAHLDEDRQLYTVLNSVDVIGDDRVYRRRILGERLVEGTPAATQIAEYSDDDILSKMAVWDLTHKLPDDFLLVEDRMSMAHALESRVPFLDTELIELALSIPVDERVDGTNEASRMRRTGKGILREAMTGLVPRSVLERDKQGFTMPTSTFVEESLFDHAERILAAPTIARAGLIDPEYIRQLLAAGPDPALTHHHRMLWKLVALEIWHQMYIEGGKMAPPASIDSYAT